MGKMCTRAEAVRLILRQFTTNSSGGEKVAWHYGLCELRDLMGAIYGGPPETSEEKIPPREKIWEGL